MKRLKNLFVALALCAPLLTAAAQDIEINAENFPDENFRNYLLAQSYGEDEVLTEAEIKEITEIDVSSGGVSSLKGIEHFTALRELSCYDNQLTTLDVSKNTALTSLHCASTQLTTLDVSNNTALRELYCYDNQLTTLDVSKNTALTFLWCYSNQLTTLDVSNNTALTSLFCFSNQLTTLDVSNNTALRELYCYNNQLTTLDVSNNTALRELYCFSNQLTTLDVSNNTALRELYCFSNQLTTLDVSNNTALTSLYCFDNQLTDLDVSKNTALTSLYCGINQIKGESMDALISSLPETTRGVLYVYDEVSSNEGNVITKSQVAAAKAKGWTSFSTTNGWQFSIYEGIDDDAVGVTQPEIEAGNGTAAVYNLQGQKVNVPQKGGIYVVDGKKVVVK